MIFMTRNIVYDFSASIHRIRIVVQHDRNSIHVPSLLSEFPDSDLHLVSNIWQPYDKVLPGSRYDTCPALRPVNDVIYDPPPPFMQTSPRRDFVSCCKRNFHLLMAGTRRLINRFERF